MEPDVELDEDAKARIWGDALLAASLVALDPRCFGGLVVRAHAGPVRDRLMEHVSDLIGDAFPVRKMPSHIADERLLGGLDMAATLQSGRPVIQRGLLSEADGGLVIVPMAERLESFTVSRLCQVLDQGEVALERDGITARLDAKLSFVLLDEGIGDEEQVAPALSDRMAFVCDLSNLSIRDLGAPALTARDLKAARTVLADFPSEDKVSEALSALAMAFGVTSVRAILSAMRTAKALAALDGRHTVEDGDIETAARLVIVPRATRLPMQEEDQPPAEDTPPEPEPEEKEEPEQPEGSEDDNPAPPDGPLEDRVLEALEAAIPANLLAQLQAGVVTAQGSSSPGGGQGAKQAAQLRGRPLSARRGRLDGRNRLHVVDTLRAAAPWQRLRRSAHEQSSHIHVSQDDIRVRRFKQREESVTIFCVDASGSAALHRLGEVKGAVELLLAESYARRDYVALITFRGQTAEIILPPTRSLVRAKRALAGVPGGGGTPLAAGLDAGLAVALDARRQGRTPRLVVMSDAQANIGHDPGAGRAGARADALTSAARLAAYDVASMMIDTSARMNTKKAAPAVELASAMNALYLPLPYPNAAGLKALVETGAAMQVAS